MALWKRILILILIIVGILALIGGITAYGAYKHYYNLTNYVSDEDMKAASEKSDKADTEKALEEALDEETLTAEEAAYLESQASAIQDNPVLPNDADVYNVLLIGVDRRDTSWEGNSDAMILCSVNKKTQKVHLMSFMRDLYASIPPYGTNKLNSSCAIGGPTKTVEVIEENYKVDIDNYVCVDFTSLTDVVDAIGGVDITIDEKERVALNKMIVAQCSMRDEPSEGHLLNTTGTIHMDGYQALAYARCRNVGNSDWQRTERQRTVIMAMADQGRALKLSELNATAEKVLPLITHNIPEGRLLSLLTSLPTFLSYDILSTRVPYDNTYTIMNEILVPDMTVTQATIQDELYGEDKVHQEELEEIAAEKEAEEAAKEAQEQAAAEKAAAEEAEKEAAERKAAAGLRDMTQPLKTSDHPLVASDAEN